MNEINSEWPESRRNYRGGMANTEQDVLLRPALQSNTGAQTDYTDEQLAVIQYTPVVGEIIKVNAFAGTGKSSTLLGFAEAHRSAKILYIVFNRANREEAEKRFPANVACKTSHSLAWRDHGSTFQKAQKLISTDWRAYYVKRTLEIQHDWIAPFVIDTLKAFVSSDDDVILHTHIPLVRLRSFCHVSRIKDNFEQSIFELACRMWGIVIDIDDARFGATHDVYLKLWQLSKPRLRYDYILLDEAQDTTDCVLSVLMKQLGHAALILVGDTHQAIYGWRGATNAMAKVPARTSTVLTRSFRFNNRIANLAALFIDKMKCEQHTIIGTGDAGKLAENASRCFISRTNYQLFEQAIQTEGYLYFVGGLKSYPYDSVMDIYWFIRGQRDKVKDGFINEFQSIEEIEQYAEEAQDLDLLFRLMFASKYGHNLPPLLRDIAQRETHDVSRAHIILSNTHRAKGMEWDVVEMAQDYSNIFMGHRRFSSLSMRLFGVDIESLMTDHSFHVSDLADKVRDVYAKYRYVLASETWMKEEANIQYVALTRAKHTVFVWSQMQLYFQRVADGIELLEPTPTLAREFDSDYDAMCADIHKVGG